MTVFDNLQTLHASWKAFIAADNLNQIKRALKHNVQKYNDVSLLSMVLILLEYSFKSKWSSFWRQV